MSCKWLTQRHNNISGGSHGARSHSVLVQSVKWLGLRPEGIAFSKDTISVKGKAVMHTVVR